MGRLDVILVLGDAGFEAGLVEEGEGSVGEVGLEEVLVDK